MAEKRIPTTASIVRHYDWPPEIQQVLDYFSTKGLTSAVTAWVNRPNHDNPDGFGVAVNLRSTDVPVDKLGAWGTTAALTAAAMHDLIADDDDGRAEALAAAMAGGKSKGGEAITDDDDAILAALNKKLKARK